MTEPSRDMARAARRLADQDTARLQEVPSARLFPATVTTVTAGAASDGHALVKVTWRGQELDVAEYPDSYTPAVGHRVRCALAEDDQLILLHHSIGNP